MPVGRTIRRHLVVVTAWGLAAAVNAAAAPNDALQGAAPASPAPVEQVQRAEQELMQALVKGDADALAPLLGDDLSFTHLRGRTQNKREFLDEFRTSLDFASMKHEGPVNTRVYGDVAVLTGLSRFEVRSNRTGPFSNMYVRFLDVYTKKDGRWVLSAWQAVRLEEAAPGGEAAPRRP